MSIRFTTLDNHGNTIDNHEVGATEGRMLLCLTGFDPEEVGLDGRVPAAILTPRLQQAHAVILRVPIRGLPGLEDHAVRLIELVEAAHGGDIRWHRL